MASHKQATFNVGTIGHVANGKSTLVRSLSSVNTMKHSVAKRNNATIQLGYGNCKLFKCPSCSPPQCYHAFSSRVDEPLCKHCSSLLQLQRHISFVDCPGHDALMRTMLTGSSVMDAALLMVGADKTCPQPQTVEHLMAMEILEQKNLIVVQNKCDLVSSDRVVQQHHQEIQPFLKNTLAENSPVVPVSAHFGYNLDVVVQYLCQLPEPQRDLESSPLVSIVRSFDVNKPGCGIEQLKGAVVGGSVLKGILKVGTQVVLLPGYNNQPLKTRIASIFSEHHQLEEAVPGGLVGFGLQLDPSLSKRDLLQGQLMGIEGSMPPVFHYLEISFQLLRRSVYQNHRVKPLQFGEVLLLNVGSCSVQARVGAQKEDLAQLQLSHAICSELNTRITLSRRIDDGWRLIGWGKLMAGRE